MNKPITPETIKEIADLLDCGMVCFYNQLTGEMEYHPDPDRSMSFDEDQWTDVIDKIEKDYDNYVQFEGMDGHESFRLMEDFVNQISKLKIRAEFLNALSKRKPFQQFKSLISYYPDLREQWFAYKSTRYREFVKAQARAAGISLA